MHPSMTGLGLQAGWWSSDAVRAGERTEAWQEMLSASYRKWEVPQRVAPDFSARLRRADLADFKLIECICSPCVGRRLPLQLKDDDAPYLGIQIVMSGAERFRVGEETVAIGPGDTLLWVSDRPMEFEVTERLHKVTLMLPLPPLRERLPAGAALRSGVVGGERGFGALLFSHIRTLALEAEALGAGEAAAARRATLELILAVLAAPQEAASHRLAEQYLRNIQAYILDHLEEEGLSPGRIAQANRVSVRYLHLLFERTGRSVSAWVQEQRLQRCREAIGDPAFAACKLADIGGRWGFSDASRFSRAFKARFGQSPREYRERFNGRGP